MSHQRPKRKIAIHKEEIDHSDIIPPSPSKPSPSKPSPVRKKPPRRITEVIDYSSDSSIDNLPNDLSDNTYETLTFRDIYDSLKHGFSTQKFDIFEKGKLFEIVLKKKLLKNKKLSTENILSILQLCIDNKVSILSTITDEKGLTKNVCDIIDEDIPDREKNNQLQNVVLKNFVERFENIVTISNIIAYTNMIKKIFCDEDIDEDEKIINELISHTKRILSDCNIIWMIQSIYKGTIGKEQHLIVKLFDSFSYLYRFLQGLNDKVKNRKKFDEMFQIIVDFKLIYYLYKLEFFKKQEDVDINDFTAKYYYKSIRKYKEFKIHDHENKKKIILTYTNFSVIKSPVTKDKILLLCENIIDHDESTKNELDLNKRYIQKCFDAIFKSLESGGDKYNFISKYFLKIYEDHDFPGQMCGIYDYSTEYMEDMLLPLNYKKISDEELLKDNIFKKEKLILTSFIELLGINLLGIDLHDKKLSTENKSIISTELIRTLAIFVHTNEYLKYEPISDDFLKEFEVHSIAQTKSSKAKTKSLKAQTKSSKAQTLKKVEEKEKEEKKKEIEDIDEKIRKMEEEGNRDITNEIIENKENFLKFNEDIIKKIRTDFFHGKFDKEGNIILNLPSTIQSSKGLWNIGKLRQFLLFNLVKEYLIYVITHYSSKEYLSNIQNSVELVKGTKVEVNVEVVMVKGTKVEVKYGAEWLKGEIERVNKNGTFNITYNNNNKEGNVPKERISVWLEGVIETVNKNGTFNITYNKERRNFPKELIRVAVGQMVLQGGACVQYYSKAKRITYDLDYKFYPDRQKSLEEQLNFLKKYLLPFFKDIDLDEIIEKRNIICSSDDSGLSSSVLKTIKQNFKDFELVFFYDDRGIIKVYIQYNEIFRDKTDEERIESRKHSILDISLSKPDDKRNSNLIKSIKKNDKKTQLPTLFDFELDKNLIVLLDKEYLKQERKVLIEDSFKDTPEFITEVPTFGLEQTKTFIRKKMIEQLESLDPAFDIKKFIEKIMIKQSKSLDGNKKSLKKHIQKSIKKSIQRRRTTLRKSKKLSRRTTLRKSKRLSRTTLRKSKRLSRRRTTLRKSKRLSRKKIILV
jgi:hypothetical protein